MSDSETYYRNPFEAECGYIMGTVVENGQLIGQACIIGQAIASGRWSWRA